MSASPLALRTMVTGDPEFMDMVFNIFSALACAVRAFLLMSLRLSVDADSAGHRDGAIWVMSVSVAGERARI